MENHIIRIASIHHITHNVLRIVTDKPAGFTFLSGQATQIAINKPGWLDAERPFTFTSLPTDDFLEFTIKTYPEKEGVTRELLHLQQHDELIAHAVFGAITYKGEGVFIAGGAGVTPFISILRDLEVKNEIGKNQLLFADKTQADIILESEFEMLLGDAFVNILSDQKVEGYQYGRVTEAFLKANVSDFTKPFYICGPPSMMKEIEKHLMNIGVDEELIIKEIF